MKNLVKLMLLSAVAIAPMSCTDDANGGVNTRPVAAFKSNATSVELGSSVAFESLSYDLDGSIGRYEWDFGNSTTSDLATPAPVAYTELGEKIVTLKVWDNQGLECDEPYTKRINVVEPVVNQVEPTVIWHYTDCWGMNNVTPTVDKFGNVLFGDLSNKDREGDPVKILDRNGTKVSGIATGDGMQGSASVYTDGETFLFGTYGDHLEATKVSSPNTSLAKYDCDINIKYSIPSVDSNGDIYLAFNKKLNKFTFDGSTFTLVWSKDVGHTEKATALIAPNGVYLPDNDGKLYAFNKETGATLWGPVEYGDANSCVGALSSDGSVIFVCAQNVSDGVVAAYKAADGTEIWKNVYAGRKVENSGISLDNDGNLYFGDAASPGIVRSLKQSDGSENWQFEASARVSSCPAIDNNGNLYFGDYNGIFYSLTKDGTPYYKSIDLGGKIWSSPTIGADGTIFICSYNESGDDDHHGNVYALRTEATGPLAGAWAMYGKDQYHTSCISAK